MTSPNNSPVLQGQVVYTPADASTGFWGKVAGGLGTLLGSFAHFNGEALPNVGQAASAYGNARSASNPSIGTTRDNSNPLIYQPSKVSLPNVAPIPITPVSVNPPKPQAPVRLQALQNVTQQLNAGINPVRETRINLLNALTQGTGYIPHSQPSTTNTHVFPIQTSQGSLLPPQSRNAGSAAPHWIQEQPYSIQSVEQPVSDAPLYQAPINAASPSLLPVAHRKSLQTSQRQAEMDAQSVKSQQPIQPNNFSSTAYDFITNPYRSTLDPSRLFEGKELNLADLKQLFHTYDLQYYGAKTPSERLQATQNIDLLKQKLAANMAYGPDRLVTEDGYVVIGDEAFNSKTAYKEALDYLNYIQKHDELRPSKFPTDPNKLDPKKHDVTDKINALKTQIVTELKNTSYPDAFFRKMLRFGNNKAWDSQGQYGLPGQQIVRNSQGKIIFKKNGFPETKDEYALYKYNGRYQQIRAGALSNSLYGYGAAVIYIPRLGAQGIGQALSIIHKVGKVKDILDNPQDQKSIADGWDMRLHELLESH